MVLLDSLLQFRFLGILILASFGGLAVQLFGCELEDWVLVGLHRGWVDTDAGVEGGCEARTFRLKRAFSRPDMIVVC